MEDDCDDQSRIHKVHDILEYQRSHGAANGVGPSELQEDQQRHRWAQPGETALNCARWSGGNTTDLSSAGRRG